MLKIGSIRWRGKCARHPGFDPCDGPGAVRGACAKCMALVEILTCHQRMLVLMRGFAQPASRKTGRDTDAESQQSLFGEF